jgi:SHS family lactate transporter-like MFS transporter
MATIVAAPKPVVWWREPTKDQWLAWWAGWLGWTLDAFDFTVFLPIMVPIAKEFGVSLTEVTAVLTVTLWMRLVGACASGWLADRVGRKAPLMISIAWYSLCNFIAGFPRPSGFCSSSAPCSASGWGRNGPPARPSPWSPGRRGRAGS